MTKVNKNRVVALYHSMLDFAFGRGMITKDNYDHCYSTIHPIKKRDNFIPSHQRITFALEPSDVDKILSAIPDWSMDKVLLRFLLGTGFRLGEALGLTPNEFNHAEETIEKRFIWGLNQEGKYERFARTKNGTEGVYVVSHEIAEMLSSYIIEHHLQPEDMLFPQVNDRSKACDPSAFRKRLHAYCKKAGAPDVWPHIGRHTFCTNLSKKTGYTNEDKKTIELLTGHSYAVDQETYTHASEEKMRDLVNKA